MLTRSLSAKLLLPSFLALCATAVLALAQTTPAPPAASASNPPAAATDPEPATEPGNIDRRQAMAACRTDAKRLCGDVRRGKGARMDCLVANRDKVSPECSTAMAAIEAGATERRKPRGKRAADAGERPMAACQTDLATHCGSVEKGNGGRMQCLRANDSKLTPECRTSLEQARIGNKERRQAMRQACDADVTALCTGVERANGGLRKCLTENAAKLSQPCSDAISRAPGRKS